MSVSKLASDRSMSVASTSQTATTFSPNDDTPTGQVADYLQNRAGVKSDNRFQLTQTSVDLVANARFRLSPGTGIASGTRCSQADCSTNENRHSRHTT